MTHYRGATIFVAENGGYLWEHSDYLDISYEDDRWVYFGTGICSSIEECRKEIDEMFRYLNN